MPTAAREPNHVNEQRYEDLQCYHQFTYLKVSHYYRRRGLDSEQVEIVNPNEFLAATMCLLKINREQRHLEVCYDSSNDLSHV